MSLSMMEGPRQRWSDANKYFHVGDRSALQELSRVPSKGRVLRIETGVLVSNKIPRLPWRQMDEPRNNRIVMVRGETSRKGRC